MSHQLDPELAALLSRIARARRPAFWQLTPAEARAQFEKGAPILDLLPLPVHAVEDRRLRVAGGQIKLRLYWPREGNAAEPLPALLWFHGGGFTVGSVQSYDPLCRMFCDRAHCLVIGVDYRLAPEHRFPTAVDDACAALHWVLREATGLTVDRSRIAVAGDSAGGTLATVTALRTRDEGIALAGQLLVYPGTSAHQDSESHWRHADDVMLSRQTLQWFFANYLRSEADRVDWRFAPLLAPRLAGAAPAWVALAACDALVDEGRAYAERLRDEGVPVELKVYAGMVHNFFNLGRYVKVARVAHADFVRALRRMFDAAHGSVDG